MLRRFGTHVRQNVIACLALFVALRGTSYAAATIGSAQVVDNSLQSRDLKDNAAVRTQDVVNDNVVGGGLVGADVRNNSLTGNDVANLTGADINGGAIGSSHIADGQVSVN